MLFFQELGARGCTALRGTAPEALVVDAGVGLGRIEGVVGLHAVGRMGLCAPQWARVSSSGTLRYGIRPNFLK